MLCGYSKLMPEATWQDAKGINSYQPLVPEKTDGKRLPFWEGVEKVLYPGILVTSKIQIWQPILTRQKVLPKFEIKQPINGCTSD